MVLHSGVMIHLDRAVLTFDWQLCQKDKSKKCGQQDQSHQMMSRSLVKLMSLIGSFNTKTRIGFTLEQGLFLGKCSSPSVAVRVVAKIRGSGRDSENVVTIPPAQKVLGFPPYEYCIYYTIAPTLSEGLLVG